MVPACVLSLNLWILLACVVSLVEGLSLDGGSYGHLCLFDAIAFVEGSYDHVIAFVDVTSMYVIIGGRLYM